MPEVKTDKKSCFKCHKVYDKKLKTRKVCQCHAITYCGQECQVEDRPRHEDNCVPVMVTEVGEKGRGLVAAKDIKMGERILIDSLAISLESIKLGDVITRKVTRSLKEQIQALPEEKATQFYNLKSLRTIVYSERDLKTLRKENCFNEMKIFQSNKFERYTEVLFFILSLINHSCAPNVEESYLPDVTEDQEIVDEYELRAVRDISKGEEITIFYLPKSGTIVPREVRQIYLKAKFGFDCKCSVCCGDVDNQDRITEKITKILLLSPDSEEFRFCQKYDTSVDERKRMAIKGAVLVTLTRKLHIGSAESKIASYTCAVRAAQLARVQVLLDRAMDVWKDLVMTTGFVAFKVEYEEMNELVAKWTPQFLSKKPPTKKEIDAFYFS